MGERFSFWWFLALKPSFSIIAMSDETELNRKVKLSTDKESEMNKSPGARLAKWIDLV